MGMKNYTLLINLPNRQSGVALFFALIVLLMMSLAAVSMIRSVDTNTQIAGNLSYRQNTLLSTALGQEALSDVLGPLPVAQSYANGTATTTTSTLSPIGYYATCRTFDGSGSVCSGANLTADSSWSPGSKSTYATGVGISSNGQDSYGNTIQYIVERMCTSTGTSANTSCLMDGVPADNNAKNVISMASAGAPTVDNNTPVYRVTVRIDGPKNTVTYVQGFMS
jgi:type IV pilus assembly protein PilX